MAFNVTFNGTTYPLPSVGDRIYATYINTFLTAVANNALAKSGGTFALVSDTNFGATAGLVAKYFKSISSNISTTGVLRLANNEGIGFRNAANGADVILKVNASDRLEYDAVAVPTISSTDVLTNKSISGATNTLTNIPSGALGSTTGSGAVVLATSPTLVTPALGTPSSATLTNATGLPIDGGTTGTLPVSRGGTGITSFGTGVATALGQNVSGSGSIALTGSPTFTTPALGTPSAAVLTNATGLPLTTGVTGTLPIANGGTGQTTAQNARNALLPTQTSSSGKFLKTDGTDVSWASASGGAGEINAILNASGADGTTGWTGTSVVSGSSSPLNPIVTTAFSIANSATTESSTSGGYYPFTMPSGLLNRKLKVEFTFTTPATDVWRVSVYQGSTRVALSTDSSSVTTLPASVTGGKFTAYFDTDSSTSWTLSVTRTSGSTGACVITNVIVGPGIQPQGAVVGTPVSYTPTITNFGNGVGYLNWSRSGSKIKITGSLVVGSTVPTGIFNFSLPTGLTADYSTQTKGLLGTDAYQRVGLATTYLSEYFTGHIVRNVSSNTTFYVNGNGTSYTSPQDWGASVGGVTLANGDVITIDMEVPIAEWAGSGTVNLAQNDVEWAYNSSTSTSASDTTSFAYGPSGASIQSITAALSRRVRFQRPIQSGDVIVVEVDTDNTGVWVPLPATQGSTGRQISALTVLNNTQYGMGSVKYINSTDVEIDFGQYRSSDATTLGGAGPAWSTVSGAKWRVRKSSAGAAVGFGIVTSTSSGLVPASGSLGYIRLGTQNGHGSTNTTIRRFSTVIANTSTDVTYADSSTLGATFTINRSGLYSISYTDAGSTSCNMGVSLNSSQLTTNIAGITQADRLFLFSPTGNDLFQTGSVTLYLNSGDVIRAHTDGVAAASFTARTQFTIQRIY